MNPPPVFGENTGEHRLVYRIPIIPLDPSTLALNQLRSKFRANTPRARAWNRRKPRRMVT